MVYKLDDEGNAVHTRDMGDLVMFISMSEPFCVPSTSFPGMYTNNVYLYDYDENGCVDVAGTTFDMASAKGPLYSPYHIPPQDIGN
ncbi:hypothetical protein F2Q69_00019575 [Brassica cretica]|nr:hypothetical protein F2Q69_00019575 [Brassica cretica]